MPTVDDKNVKPVTVRTDEERARLSPDAPGPESTVHHAISQASLTYGVRVQNAHAHCVTLKSQAKDWLEYHKKMTSELGGSSEVSTFFDKGYEAQVNGADDWLENELTIIEQDYASADKKQLVFATHEQHIPEHVQKESWTFDAPMGFGDLTYEQQVALALAGKDKE